MPSMSASSPSKYLSWSSISWFQRPSSLRSRTRTALRTMKSPDEVALHEEVLVVRLDAGGGAHDVGDGGGRGDGEDVGVAHAVLGRSFRGRVPVHFAAAWDFDFDAALVFEEVDGVLREDAAVPFGAFVGLVGAALAGEFAAGARRRSRRWLP